MNSITPVQTDSTRGKTRADTTTFFIGPLLSCAVAAAIAATPAAPPAAVPPAPAAHAPSIKETLAAVSQIAHELKPIDARLGKLGQSLAGVDASLKPVGAIVQPAALRELILRVAACGAGLIVLHALLRRWSSRGVSPADRKVQGRAGGTRSDGVLATRRERH